MRTDIHRPSVIQPQDYDFVGVWYDPNEEFEIGSAYMLRFERENIMAHMEKMGGRWANHQHGGTCHVCGASAVYLAVFWHQPTNEYIRVGEDCTEKMDMGEPERFATARRAAKNARDAIAGKKKALLILKDLGLEAAWKYYETTEYLPEYEESTCQDMVANLVRHGSFSDKQEEFLKTLLYRIENREAIKAQRAAEKASAQDCPTGRMKIKGTVLSLKEVEGNYGKTLKMFVKTTEGYTLWGTVPGSLHSIEKGEEVIFTATVEPARDDKKHGFFFAACPRKGIGGNVDKAKDVNCIYMLARTPGTRCEYVYQCCDCEKGTCGCPGCLSCNMCEWCLEELEGSRDSED